jgi:hypothetical protein
MGLVPTCCGEVVENQVGSQTFYFCRGCRKEPQLSKPSAPLTDSTSEYQFSIEVMHKAVNAFIKNHGVNPTAIYLSTRMFNEFFISQNTNSLHAITTFMGILVNVNHVAPVDVMTLHYADNGRIIHDQAFFPKKDEKLTFPYVYNGSFIP